MHVFHGKTRPNPLVHARIGFSLDQQEYQDLQKIYKDKGQESNDKWLPDVDRRRLDMAKTAGLITEDELKTLLESGLNYVPVCSTWFGRSVARAFQVRPSTPLSYMPLCSG